MKVAGPLRDNERYLLFHSLAVLLVSAAIRVTSKNTASAHLILPWLDGDEHKNIGWADGVGDGSGGWAGDGSGDWGCGIPLS